ncbi:protein WFDC11 isoform X4 [Arvicanthis niloticus]|uniref:protein WFDC11 isoform X4 n=1 Tax=Arvicanthis niloticus TaxID=61156 RepID=UPI00402B9EBB
MCLPLLTPSLPAPTPACACFLSSWESKKEHLQTLEINIMKPSLLPCLVFLWMLLLLPALGGTKNKYYPGELLLEECWGQPKANDCTKKCSRTFKCVYRNHTCCWTYCGNICAENGKFFERKK